MTDLTTPSWFWAHDIEDAAQLRDLAAPHMQLERIAGYRRGNDFTRRFVALTADGDSPRPSVGFGLVLDHRPHQGRRLHIGLDLAAATELFSSGANILDFATYHGDGGVRSFAVITEPQGPEVTFQPAVPPAQLTDVLKDRYAATIGAALFGRR